MLRAPPLGADKHEEGMMQYVRQLLSEDALTLIHESSKGIPRRINNLCDLALLMGFQRELKVIGPSIVKAIWV